MIAAGLKPCILFLGGYMAEEYEDRRAEFWRDHAHHGLRVRVKLVRGDPGFDRDGEIDGQCYWVRPVAFKPEDRRKLLRKQIFASLVLVLGYVVKYQARLIMGEGQGALIAALMSLPLVQEAACRARIVTSEEMRAFRDAWARVAGILVIDPAVMPSRSDSKEVREAVPEMRLI